MATSSNSKSHYHMRSASFPCRSHPNNGRIEDELNKLKIHDASTSPTAETICNGICGLEALYTSANDLLTRKALSLHQHEKRVHELLDGSLRLVDVCSLIRDLFSQVKENARELQSALRRRKEDFIAKYNQIRMKVRKDAKKVLAEVKQIEKRIVASATIELDDHLILVIRVLREVVLASTSLFQTILVFLSKPSNSKKRGGSLVSRLLQKETVACDDQSSLKSLEASTESIENGLECLFRSLVKSRISLLNAVSH